MSVYPPAHQTISNKKRSVLTSTLQLVEQQSQKQNKQSRITSTDTLNYKLTRNVNSSLLTDCTSSHNNSNGIDTRIKSLQAQNQQLQKMYESVLITHKEEMTSILRRTTKLEENIIKLQNGKIENEQQIQFLKAKLHKYEQKQHEQMSMNNHYEQQRLHNQEYELKVQQIQQKYQSMENQLKNQVNLYKNKYLEQKQKAQILKQKIFEYQKLRKNNQQLSIKYEEKQGNYLQISFKYKEAVKKCQQLIKNGQRTQKQQKQLKDHILKLNKSIQVMKQQYKRMQKQNAQTSTRQTSNSELKKLQKTLVIKDQQLINIKQVLDKRQKEIQQLQANLHKWQSQCRKIAQTRDQMEAENGRLKLQIIKNASNSQQSQKIRKQIQHCNKQKQSFASKLKDISSQISTLNSQNQRLIIKCNSCQSLISTLQTELKNQKIKHQQLIQEIQQCRSEYQKALQIQSKKSEQLLQLVQCFKEKIKIEESRYRQELRQYSDISEEKNRKIKNLQQQIIKYEQQLQRVKREGNGTKDLIYDKQRQWDRKTKLLQQQKTYLQSQVQKWKSLRSQSINECQQQKRQIRRMKSLLQQSNQQLTNIKQKQQSITSLESKIQQLQLQKSSIIQNHSFELNNMQKSYELKIKQLKQQHQLYDQKIKAKVQAELTMQHRQEIGRIRRKSEDTNYTASKHEKRVIQLQAQLASYKTDYAGVKAEAKYEIQKYKRDLQRNNKQSQINIDKYQEVKHRMTIYKDQLQDLSKKYREKQAKIQQMYGKLKKCQSINFKYEHQFQQLDTHLKQIEKNKWNDDQKIKNLEKIINKLSAQLQIKQQQKLQYIRQFQKTRQKHEKLSNQAKLLKQKANLLQQNRRDYYLKLSAIDCQYFKINYETKQNQLQFLAILAQKIRSLCQIALKLQHSRHQIQKDLETKLHNQQFSKTLNFTKNAEQQNSIKQNYNTLYKKYLKYKQAFIHCKTKLQRYRLQTGNDRRFTQQILDHCKMLITKVQWNQQVIKR